MVCDPEKGSFNTQRGRDPQVENNYRKGSGYSTSQRQTSELTVKWCSEASQRKMVSGEFRRGTSSKTAATASPHTCCLSPSGALISPALELLKPNLLHFYQNKAEQNLPSYLKFIESKLFTEEAKDFLISCLKKMPAMRSHRLPALEAKGTGAVSLAPQLIYNSILFCAQSQTLSNHSDPSFHPRAVHPCFTPKHSLSSISTRTNQD